MKMRARARLLKHRRARPLTENEREFMREAVEMLEQFGNQEAAAKVRRLLKRVKPMSAAKLIAMPRGAAIEFEPPQMQLELKPADFDEDYARFQSPEYAKLAREAERLMPRPRFRKFGKPRDES